MNAATLSFEEVEMRRAWLVVPALAAVMAFGALPAKADVRAEVNVNVGHRAAAWYGDEAYGSRWQHGGYGDRWHRRHGREQRWNDRDRGGRNRGDNRDHGRRGDNGDGRGGDRWGHDGN